MDCRLSFDRIVHNARIVDGTGAPWHRGDVGIRDGRITFVGRLPESATANEIIDARDRILSPGFIDVHTHLDFYLLRNPLAPEYLRQGVTTAAIGLCGESAAPLFPGREKDLNQSLLCGAKPDWRWSSFGEWLDVLDRQGLGLNIAGFIGQGTVRLDVMGMENRPATENEIAEMRTLVERSMDEGAFGMSTGLVYPPGIFSSSEEVIQVARGLTKRHGLYMTHMRNQAEAILECIQETIDLGQRCGIPIQISHLKVKDPHDEGVASKALSLLEEARRGNVDAAADQYPYEASHSTLRTVLPAWAQAGGIERVIERLSDEAERVRILEETRSSRRWNAIVMNCGGPKSVLISDTPATPEWVGRNLQEAAEEMGIAPLEALANLVVANGGHDSACFFSMREKDIREIMVHPLVMVGSDGIPAIPGCKCHPRTTGTFPRILGRYVRERKVLSLEEAIRKMTSLPATRLGLGRKGIIREGMDADLVLFDPDTIRDGSDYQKPSTPPIGIDMVLVAGEVAVRNNELTGATRGRALRK